MMIALTEGIYTDAVEAVEELEVEEESEPWWNPEENKWEL